MDKALVFGTEACRLESCQDHLCYHGGSRDSQDGSKGSSDNIPRACGVVVSHPLSMRGALSSNLSMSICCSQGSTSLPCAVVFGQGHQSWDEADSLGMGAVMSETAPTLMTRASSMNIRVLWPSG